MSSNFDSIQDTKISQLIKYDFILKVVRCFILIWLDATNEMDIRGAELISERTNLLPEFERQILLLISIALGLCEKCLQIINFVGVHII